MLWHVSEFRPRVSLRLNNDATFFRIRNNDQWQWLSDRTFGSATATVQGSLNGNRATMFSEPGFEQIIALADVSTNRTIGLIRVKDDGALRITDNPILSLGQPLSLYWHKKISVMLGVAGFTTINITDMIGEDEDILRYQIGHRSIHIPRHYTVETPQYDLGLARNYNCPATLQRTPSLQSLASVASSATTHRVPASALADSQDPERAGASPDMPELIPRPINPPAAEPDNDNDEANSDVQQQENE